MSLRLGGKAALAAGGIGAALLLGWLASSQGPLAPAKVTVAKVEQRPLVASTFGIGTVEAQRSYALGPTLASRVARVLVDQGDAVRAGQLLAELDPVDLDDRVASGEAAAGRAASAIKAADAQLAEARSRAQLARASAQRYAELRVRNFVSKEASDAKQHDASAAAAAVDAARAQLEVARRDRQRALADVAGVEKLRAQARLRSPVAGVVTARLVEPGTTIVAGQAVLQVIDPRSVWIKARIDQAQAGGVRVGQPAAIVLRSEPNRSYPGRVARVDWVSDAVTEERIVNVEFDARPEGMPVGELVEVTIRTAELSRALSVPAAAVKRINGQDGVWQLSAGRVVFQPVRFGVTTLDGRSQIVAGLKAGDAVVVHSERELKPDAPVKVIAAIVRAAS